MGEGERFRLGADGRVLEHVRPAMARAPWRSATPRGPVSPQSPSLAILAPSFFPPHAKAPSLDECNWGGGERYLIDLGRLCLDLGFDVHVFQPSAEPFDVEVRGLPLHGLGVWGWDSFEYMHRVSQAFTALARDSGFDRALHFNLDVATGAAPDSISITHGVWWDQKAGPWRDRYDAWLRVARRAHTASQLVVSVDANGINWARAALGYDVAARMRYIPNYADESLYAAQRAAMAPGTRGNDGRIRVLFPRRLVYNRGTGLMLDIAEDLLRAHPAAELVFTGKGLREYAERIDALARRLPGRVGRVMHQTDGMAEEYLRADVAVIPTLDCEGTSLSCIEAMAAGCAVVATHAGGLANLVLDGWNGRLVEPSPEAVRAAISELLADPEQAERMGRQARATFEQAFTMARWRDRWCGVLRELGWIGEDGTAVAA